MLWPGLRPLATLFELATRARHTNAIGEGAIGADGYGFAIANGIESWRYQHVAPAGEVVVHPDVDIDVTGARLRTLTQSRLSLGRHAEERFGVALFVATPTGGKALVNFRAAGSGPGLAIGIGRLAAVDEPLQRRLERMTAMERDATPIAAALAKALDAVPLSDVCLSSWSDFGRDRVIFVDGRRVKAWPSKRPKPVAHYPVTDPGPFEGALQEASANVAAGCSGREAIEIISRLASVKSGTRLSGSAARRCDRAFARVVDPLWALAVTELERIFDSLPISRPSLPLELDVAPGLVLSTPQTNAHQVERGRLLRLFERERALMVERIAAQPWWSATELA